MKRLLYGFLVLALVSQVNAQVAIKPGLTSSPLQGVFGGTTNDQFFRSQVQHATSQMLADLKALRQETGRLNLPLANKIEISQLADRTVREAEALQRLSFVTSDRRTLLLADQKVDRAADAYIARVQSLTVTSPNLARAIARAQYADLRLHELFGDAQGGVGNGLIIKTASALVSQVNYLREVAKSEFPSLIYTPQLDREIRTFGLRVARIGTTLQAGGTTQQAIADYSTARQQWQVIAPGLNGLVSDVSVRLQIARVDDLFRLLGEQLGAGTIPVHPGQPGFGILTRGSFACGAGEGGGPRVCVFTQIGSPPVFDFFAFDPNFRGGVRVAVADLTGDGFPELIAAPGGPLPGQQGLPPIVRVFDGRTMRLISEFLAYDRSWTGGVHIAAANITPQGRAIVVTGAEVGAGPHVKAFDLVTGRELASFFAYDQNYRGGVRVALGDVDGDGFPDIVTSPGPGHPPQIKVFSGLNARPIANWMAYDNSHTVGAYVATADLSRNGRVDVIVGPDVRGCGLVRVFDPIRGRRIGEVTPYPNKFKCGIRVAAHDVNRDGIPDVVCAPGPDVPAPIRVFDGRNSKPIVEFYPFEQNFAGGVFIGAR